MAFEQSSENYGQVVRE